VKDIIEKVSYLQGMSEGLTISDGSPQGKVIAGILNVLNEMADELAVFQHEMVEIRAYLEDMDEDLLDLEESLSDEEYTPLVCDNCGELIFVMQDDEDEILELVCPSCQEIIYVNDSAMDFETLPPDEVMDDQTIS
jgi:hypothetical protein